MWFHSCFFVSPRKAPEPGIAYIRCLLFLRFDTDTVCYRHASRIVWWTEDLRIVGQKGPSIYNKAPSNGDYRFIHIGYEKSVLDSNLQQIVQDGTPTGGQRLALQ
jgi:hypothetical protein